MNVVRQELEYPNRRKTPVPVNRTYSLADVIRNHLRETDHDDGAVESAQRCADNCAEVLGKLIDFFVDKKLMTFDDAKKITDYYRDDFRPVDESVASEL